MQRFRRMGMRLCALCLLFALLTGAVRAADAEPWVHNGEELDTLAPEAVAVAFGGEMSGGAGFLHAAAWLSEAQLEALLLDGPSGDAISACYSAAPRSYSSYEAGVWRYHRVLGLDLHALASALGVDTAHSVTLHAYAADGGSFALRDAFGLRTTRAFYSPAGGSVPVMPLLGLAQTVVDSRIAPGEAGSSPLLAAPTAADACRVFAFGQGASDEQTGANWLEGVTRLCFGEESDVISAEGRALPLSALLLAGIYRTSYSYITASGERVTEQVTGLPLTVLLELLDLRLAQGEELLASGTGERRIGAGELSRCFVAWEAKRAGDAVENATALRLYCPGRTESQVVLGELTALSRAAVTPPAFHDMDGYGWAAEAVDALCAAGIVEGDGTGAFHPERALSRGNLLLMLERAYALSGRVPSDAAVLPFDDVPETSPYAAAARAARALGIAQGDGSRFRPERSVTRAEAIALLHRTLRACGVTLPEGGEPPFLDTAALSADFAASVSALSAAGIITGSDGLLHPDAPMTRAQFAVALHRALEYHDARS